MSTVTLSRGHSSRRSLSSLSTTSTSLSHTISNIDSSKPAVVIEIGTKLTKCGFAGEFVPRAIIRTQFIDESLNLNHDVLKRSGAAGRPDISVLFKFFRYIFYSHLLSMPRDRRVIIVESILSPSDLRKTICKVLLELLDAPSVMFIPSHLCCTFPFNTDFAMVVDVGYKETLALPIAEGVTMLNSWEISNAGAQQVEERLRILLKDYGWVEGPDNQRRKLMETDWAKIDENNIIEDISVRFIFCTPIERSRVIQEKGIDNQLDCINEVKLPLGSEFLIVPGYVRYGFKKFFLEDQSEAACEVFFEDSREDEISLPKMIHKLIAKCPIDLRKQMFKSILMVGGPTLIPGFLARLKAELHAIGVEQKLSTCQDIRFFRFQDHHFELFAGWLGGSMFGAMQDAIQPRSVTRDAWLEKQILPDWTDFVEYNMPCGKLEAER